MLPTSVLLGTRHAWVKENSNSHCVAADFCLSTLGLLGEMTDRTFDEFIYQPVSYGHTLHRLDAGDIMVNKSELLFCLEFTIKSISENSSRILVLETMTTLVLSASSFFVFFPHWFGIPADTYIVMSGTLLNIWGIMFHLISLSPMKSALGLSPLYRWENRGTEELSHFSKEYTRNKWQS